MQLRIRSALMMIAALAICCALAAQDSKNITIRLVDGRTGKPLAASNVLIRINHQKTVHAEWTVANDDLSGNATLPTDAADLAIQATYDNNMEVYINCDSVKDNPPTGPHWYKLSDVLATGVVTPNGCGKQTAPAKPGELVVFARIKNWRDRYQQDFSE
jgi:hypothetical protein